MREEKYRAEAEDRASIEIGPDYSRLKLLNLKEFSEGDPCLDHLVFAQMLYRDDLYST